VPKDLSRLKKHEIDAYVNEPYRKSGDLLKGYQAAADPEKWEEEIQARVDAQNEEAANASVDELEESEAGDDEDERPKTKKRKRESQPAKKPKSVPKKRDAADGSTRRKAAGGGKAKVSKSKATVESEDEGDRADDVKPPTKKAKPADDDDGTRIRGFRFYR
jgi:hypothetical protein